MKRVATVFLAVSLSVIALFALAAENEQTGPSQRPIVKVVLEDGSRVEGVLDRFASGVYTLVAEGKPRTVLEDDIRSIRFVVRPHVPLGEAAGPEAIPELVKRLRCSTTGDLFETPQVVDPSVIPKLAAAGPGVIPPLIAKLKKDSTICRPVGEVFLQMGPDIAPLLIEEFRDDPQDAVRGAVFMVLYESGVKVIAHLDEMMKDPDPRVRKLALDVLRNLSVTSGVSLPASLDKTLIAALSAREKKTREQILRVLGRIGTGSDLVVPTLIKAMTDDKYADVRCSTLSALAYIGRQLEKDDPDLQQVVQALSDAAVADPSDLVRGYAALHLGQLGPKARAAGPALLKASGDRCEHVRSEARQALYRTGVKLEIALEDTGLDKHTSELIKALAGFGDDVDPFEMDTAPQTDAQNKLTGLGPKNLEALMLAVRLDEGNRCWIPVGAILGAWGRKVLPELDRFADDEHDRVRHTVAMAWGRMNLNSLPAKLPQLLHDNNKWVRCETVATLGRLSRRPVPRLRKAVVPLLIESLTEQTMQRYYWQEAVRALREVGPAHPDVIPALIEQMKNAKNDDFREIAACELGKLGDQLTGEHEDLDCIVNALAQAMERESVTDVRKDLVLALACIGPRAKAALPALRKAEDDDCEEIRTAAREAIDKITGKCESTPADDHYRKHKDVASP